MQHGFLRTALKISVINMLINIVLSVGKLVIGTMTHSSAVVSDGVHSAADALSGIALIVGIQLSARRADAKHPYGHERLECVAAIVLAVVIGITGATIGLSAVDGLLARNTQMPVGVNAIWAPLISIAVKECMFRYTKHAAEHTKSSALLADAWHQRSDALSSVGGLIGVVGARCGVPMLDHAAGLLISLMIVKAAVDIFADATRKMTDRSCDGAFERAVCETVYTCTHVESIEDLKTRLFGNRVCVEITVAVKETLTSKEAFAVVMDIQQTVLKAFSEIKACAVHIHPCKTENGVL